MGVMDGVIARPRASHGRADPNPAFLTPRPAQLRDSPGRVPRPVSSPRRRLSRATPRHPGPAPRTHSPTSPAAAAPTAPKGRPGSTDPSCSTSRAMASPRALRRLRGGDRAGCAPLGCGGGGRIRGGAAPAPPPGRGSGTWSTGNGGSAGGYRAGGKHRDTARPPGRGA